MAKRPNALGRGLGALIDDQKYETKNPLADNGVSEVSLDLIEVNPYQPRTEFDEEALQELAESIRKLGIIQPLTVRKLHNDTYQLISGERRLRASKLAGLTQVPAYVREADDQEMLEFALVENIQREDLNAIEIAISYQRLIDECKLTQEEMSDRVGKKRSTVANYLRLLKLPAEIQLGLREKAISMGHARALVAVEDPEVQIMVYTRVVTEELSVRSTEELVRLIADPAQEEKKEKKPLSLPNSHRDVEGLLATKLQSKIQINRDTAGKGKIVINFKSDDDFSRMAALFEKLND